MKTAFFFTIFLVIFSFTVTNMAAAYIVSDLGGDHSIATYTITFFSIGNALGIPLGTPLTERLGPGRLLLFSLLLFAFFCLTSALATDYPTFILSRTFEGFVSGPLYSVIFRLFSIFQTPKQKPLFFSILVTLFTVGPALGASWGGWIAYDYHWSYIFYINAAFLTLLGLFLWIKLRNYHPRIEIRPFNGTSYTFFTLGLLSYTIALTMGQQLDWLRSPLINTLLVIGTFSTGFYLLWDWHHPVPLLKLHFLKIRLLRFSLVSLALVFSAYFGMIILLALWLNLYANYTPIWIGVLIGNMAIAGLFPFTLLLDALKKIDPRIFLSLGVLLLVISTFHTAYFNIEVDFKRIAISRIIAGFGIALCLPPLFRLTFQPFAEKESLDVLSLFQIVRTLASGLGTAIYATIWLRREVFFHDRLGSQITPLSIKTRAYFEAAKQVQLDGLKADAKLGDLLDRQATSLGLEDTFYLMAWILLGLFVLSLLSFLLIKRKKQISIVRN
ncbi:MAG: MFS transporter [Verrucomicrobia bacterium]|nr:MFS transporter [Verrucomicrobiota bacterium]